ncbi:probable serine/threonine-protein kinase nek3 [Harmonia axyridis]|uniref:probable serine/threonine-protein kinase nek3 n=1 Tax=Harmonia axyridis TaxID=115357 RepID=UPI001E276898|nr:probable serine/threonine-protein kinase nek3 [Harmonia axyridis]
MSVGDERLARSVALENAYVHDVYEQFYDNPQSKPWPKVKSFLDSLEPGSIVCDIGCGNGKYLSLNNAIFNIGGDKSLRLTNVAREKDNEVIILDNLSLPFRDDSLDAVISIAVIHHLATTERRVNAIRELARVLRIGGRIIISVWAMEQSHRKFESQDVLVPWRRPKNLLNTPSFELTSATSTSEDDSYLPYNAYTQTSDTESNKSLRSRITLKRRNRRQKNMNPGRNLSQSSSSLSSPNETCYSFVRRALQRLAGGRRVSMHKPWFLESWTTCHKESSSKRFDPGGIQPCECCDCMDNVQDIPIELRRIDDETIAIGQRRKTFPSSQLMSDLPQAGFKSRSLTNIKTVENNDTVVSVQCEEDDNIETKEICNEKEIETVKPEIQIEGSSRHLGKPKLVKQKKSVCEEDADEALDQPTDMANISRTPSSMFKTLHTNRRSSILKQRSLNEELMSDRVQEKERVRRNIQKQVSLNEELIYQRHTFESFKDSILSVSTSKRFQLIKTGFTNKFKNSTNNIEKVTGQSLRNGFARMFQNWKSSEGSSPLTPKDILETKLSSTNEDVQQKEPIERRSSKEDGSDSSKDSSLQSDTSVDSEDSFASVIFVPKSNPMSPTPLPSDPTSPKVRTSSMPTSPKLKQSSCPTSPRIKQMPLTVYPLTKQLSSPKPTTKQEFLEMPCFENRDTLTVKKPPERCKPLANKYTVVPIPEFKRIVQPCPNTLSNTSPNLIPKCQVNPPKQKSVEEEKATETRTERLKRIREMLSQSPGFALKANKANFPLIRHSSAADGKVSAEPLPKLISLELFNPETDDKDSDSSAISSPDSVDSIVSVKSDQKRPVEEESRFKFPTYKNTKQNKLLEAAAGVASSLDEAVTKVIKTSPKFSKRQVRATDVMSVIKRSYSFETTPLVPKENSPNHWKEDSNIHLKDFAEKLSEKLLQEIDEYQKKTKRHLDNTSLENINDPYIHRLSTELDDLSKLSAEIKKQNEYLAKLSASEISFNRCAVCKKNDCKCRYNRKSRTKVEQCAKNGTDTVVDDKNKNTGDIVKLDSSRSNSSNEFLEKDRCTPDKTSTSSESDNVLRFNSKNFVRLGNSTDSCDSEKGSSTTSMVSMISSTATSFNLLSESSIDSMSSERTNTDFLERGELSSSGRGSNEGSTASLVSVPEAAITPARNGSFKNPLKRSECITSSTSSLESSSRKAPSNVKGKNLNSSTFSGTTSQESLVSENMGGEITYHRYYHVFREGELDQLIEKFVGNLHIISSYYDHSSWCIVAEKVHVWTI